MCFAAALRARYRDVVLISQRKRRSAPTEEGSKIDPEPLCVMLMAVRA